MLCFRAGLGSMVVEDIKIPSKFVGLSMYQMCCYLSILYGMIYV